MSDMAPALVGALVGGVLSLGGVWVQNYAANEKDFRAEKKQKIELILEIAIKIDACQREIMMSGSATEICEKGMSPYRLLSLTGLYAPEMKAVVSTYLNVTTEVERKTVDCDLKHAESPEQKLKSLECIRAILKNENLGGNELGAIQDKAEALVAKLN